MCSERGTVIANLSAIVLVGLLGYSLPFEQVIFPVVFVAALLPRLSPVMLFSAAHIGIYFGKLMLVLGIFAPAGIDAYSELVASGNPILTDDLYRVVSWSSLCFILHIFLFHLKSERADGFRGYLNSALRGCHVNVGRECGLFLVGVFLLGAAAYVTQIPVMWELLFS